MRWYGTVSLTVLALALLSLIGSRGHEEESSYEAVGLILGALLVAIAWWASR